MNATGRILITGFEPFDDVLNASQVLVDSLREDLPAPLRPFAARVELGILPVDTERIGERVADVLADPPAYWLLTGQDAARGRICVETRAVNRRSFGGPDNTGRLIRDEAVVDGAPDELVVSMPGVADVVAELCERGIVARVSDDAGTYLCNQALYLALYLTSSGDGDRPSVHTGFVHLPLLPEQALRRSDDLASMPLETMREALAHIIVKLAAT